MTLFEVHPGPYIHEYFYPRLMRRSDGLYILSFTCQRGPYQGWLARRILLLFVSWQYWHCQLLPIFLCCTRCISTPWIFSCAGFSAVSDMNNRLGCLLCSWGSFRFLCPTFSGWGSEVVGKFLWLCFQHFPIGDPEIVVILLYVSTRSVFVCHFWFLWWVSALVVGVLLSHAHLEAFSLGSLFLVLPDI